MITRLSLIACAASKPLIMLSGLLGFSVYCQLMFLCRHRLELIYHKWVSLRFIYLNNPFHYFVCKENSKPAFVLKLHFFFHCAHARTKNRLVCVEEQFLKVLCHLFTSISIFKLTDSCGHFGKDSSSWIGSQSSERKKCDYIFSQSIVVDPAIKYVDGDRAGRRRGGRIEIKVVWPTLFKSDLDQRICVAWFLGFVRVHSDSSTSDKETWSTDTEINKDIKNI